MELRRRACGETGNAATVAGRREELSDATQGRRRGPLGCLVAAPRQRRAGGAGESPSATALGSVGAASSGSGGEGGTLARFFPLVSRRVALCRRPSLPLTQRSFFLPLSFFFWHRGAGQVGLFACTVLIRTGKLGAGNGRVDRRVDRFLFV